jgi:hypothetical protein
VISSPFLSKSQSIISKQKRIKDKGHSTSNSTIFSNTGGVKVKGMRKEKKYVAFVPAQRKKEQKKHNISMDVTQM